MANVVVTGAAGFVGSHLVELLAAAGHRVVGVDRRPAMPAAAAERLVADLADPLPGEVADALRGAEAAFHLAGRPGVRDPAPGVDRLRHRDNVVAAEQVLALVRPQVPLVVASSSSVYGGARHGGRRPSREGDRPRPLGGYARSKLELEGRCAARAAAGGLVAVARPFTVAGERQRPDMAVARFLAAAAAGRPVRLLGSPARRRDVTDVRDVARGLARLAELEATGVVNLGTGTSHRLDELAATVAAVLGRPVTVLTAPASRAEDDATLADTTRCRFLLGFVPLTDLPALVARQAAAAGIPVTPTTRLVEAV